MAADSAEALSSEAIQQELMATEQESAAEALQDAMSVNISTTIQTISQQNGGITTIPTSTLPETMTTTEAMMATESISVGTQQGASATLSAQDQEIVDNIPQVQQHESVVSVAGSQESLVITTENVAITTVASLVASQQLANLSSSVLANYPWAARLHDCELIGDSYRGYVTSEVELELILTLHKQHTNSCWGTRQSPSSAKPSIRLMWKSQYVPFDGIPFLNTGRRATVMECQYGPRRKGAANKKQLDYDEQGLPMKRHRPTCPARIYVKKVRKFPEFRIDPNLEGKNVRQAQERALTALRLAGVHDGGEERYYVQLPLPLAHEYHDVDDIPMDPDEGDSQGQRLYPEVMHKIRELVARGVTGIYTVKHCLKEYVEKELFINLEPPPRHNKSYFPTIIDIQNHIHQAQMALATGALMPLPPLTNLPVSAPQLKEKTRKRKHAPEKLSQSSQTTAEAIASIQQHYQSARPSIFQQSGRENYQGTEAHQLALIQGSQGETSEVDISAPSQILITQGTGTGRDEGQVVIVVNASSFFSGQSDSETPTTLSLTIPASQVASLSQASLHSGPGSQAVTFIPQQADAATVQTSGSAATPQTLAFIPQSLDNSRGAVAFLTSQQTDNASQVPVSTAYLATHGQSSNILSMLDSALQASAGASAPVLRVGTNLGAVQMADSNQAPETVPGQVLTAQAAVEAVISATTAREETKQESIEGEPQAKRQALGMDFSSLVKEAVFDSQQVDGQPTNGPLQSTIKSEQPEMVIPTSTATPETENTQLDTLAQTDEGGNFIAMETQPVVMVTESVLPSLQDGHGIETDYQDNSHSLLEDREEKLAEQDTQPYKLAEQTTVQPQQSDAPYETESVLPSLQDGHGIETDYQDNNHSLLEGREEKLAGQDTQPYKLAEQTTVQPQQSDAPYETKIPSPEIPQMMETPQDVLVSMDTACKEAKEHTPANENSLKATKEEQNIQSYTVPVPCAENTNNSGQMNVPLMFESGQQLSEDEASSISHSNAVPVNNTTEVFTQ